MFFEMMLQKVAVNSSSKSEREAQLSLPYHSHDQHYNQPIHEHLEYN